MKRIFLLISLSMVVLVGSAQTSKLVGSWMMTKVETGERTQEPYFITDFKIDGTMEAMGMKAGTWKFDKKSNSVVMVSDLDKDFNGVAKIEKLTSKELILLKDGVKMYYTKFDQTSIIKNNQKANITGVWKGRLEEGGTVIMKFTAPDSLVVVTTGDGSTDRSKCSWIYNPKEKTIIIMGFSHLVRGKNKVMELTGRKFVIENSKGAVLTLSKEADSKIERLTFKEEEFPEESPDESKLPWIEGGFDRMIMVLEPVKELKFSRGVLLPDVGSFIYTPLVTKVKVDVEKPSIVLSNLSIENGDSMQYSQNVKGELQNSYNNFFPYEELYMYRVVGKETVKVPAGEFMCTVVEGIDGETKVKMWMIDTMPGVYAKIIRDSVDPFGEVEYTVKELTKIVK